MTERRKATLRAIDGGLNINIPNEGSTALTDDPRGSESPIPMWSTPEFVEFWVPGHIKSKNNYRHKRGSEEWREIKDYELMVGALARIRGVKIHPGQPVAITIAISHQRHDIDNAAKPILDGLEGVAYANDREVAELHVYRRNLGKRAIGCAVRVKWL
jgi:Holliday junction resolvase RusA-like endonuclease